MALQKAAGKAMQGMDSLSNYSKFPNTSKGAGMKAGAAIKKATSMKMPMMKKKMSPSMVAKRKKSMISNAATKHMGGLYSK